MSAAKADFPQMRSEELFFFEWGSGGGDSFLGERPGLSASVRERPWRVRGVFDMAFLLGGGIQRVSGGS